ncbi:glucoamylase family protein [Granulicella arctica]|uniref:glucoamylase family protein n=1 Tax=Granulicella arctica TaxID=940613 RepID=UPI0021E06DFE|nr:glucoamylase family protein [Granulicella arctica]
MASFAPDHGTAENSGHQAPPPVQIPTEGLPEKPSVTDDHLRHHAEALIVQWELLPSDGKTTSLPQRLKDLATRLELRLRVCRRNTSLKELTPQLELLESTRMMDSVLTSAKTATPTFLRLPHVRIPSATSDIPRIMALAEGYLAAAKGIWSAGSLTLYVRQIERHDALLLQEIAVLPVALKIALLEFILDRADEAFAAGPLPPIEQSPFSAPLHSLRRLNQYEWRTVLEPLIPFDATLRQDPAGVFDRMEEETRNTYHLRIAELAKHADMSELETAQAALAMAQISAETPDADPRRHFRQRHIGFYLFAEGLPRLRQRIGYHAPPLERFRSFLRENNEDVYILGIFFLSIFLIAALIVALIPHNAFWPVIGALLLALLPVTQGAVDLVNSSVSALLHAEALPKLDFSKSIPTEATSLVVVPTLLLSEKQVRELFEELEARYLSNQDPNLHFGLLTDMPDSVAKPAAEDQHPLVLLATRYVNDLNAKYSGQRGGAFLLLHRYRVFNSRQGVWMGWERKRGKLLDLNNLILRDFDSFPVKAGPIAVLDNIRYVITLDSDTQLPRSTAARMIGTLAHPLNQGIIDPKLRVVTHGYGILQPRVGVSVDSASRSRLAAIYSGETGFDIYTRAVSDVYQDLFGEGIFTGKGIYEVSILHEVLNRRFPKNALLSHDLIEGAYVRAGLVTDVEVIDDYPSRYAAHARRKHRWVRGDWQIAQWLFSRVPDESGHLVQNPISTISRWKIFDNLRRSLVEPITFLLLVFGWFFLPGGARYWTVAVLLLLLLPSLVQFGFALGRALLKASVGTAQDGLSTLWASLGFSLINLAFLPHQMLLSVDAIVRSTARRLLSGKYLLEWETAAQAESGKTTTSLDLYLQLSPIVAILIAAGLFLTHRHDLLHTLVPAAPVLVIWAIAPLLVLWLDSSPRRTEGPLSASDTLFLRQQALLIWRYFAEFGDAKNHWLIPDNVEEKGTLQVRKLSPTNLGMLFNARQAAYEFGFLTLPEFAEASLGTLNTYDGLEKVRGHIYNWYDIETLKAVPPFTVSAVDSGNLAASLYTLHTGALDLLKRPILSCDSFAGIEQMLATTSGRSSSAHDIHQRHRSTTDMRSRVKLLLEQTSPAPEGDADWITLEAARRHAKLEGFIHDYAPWLLPQFAEVFELPKLIVRNSEDDEIPTLLDAVTYARSLDTRLIEADRLLTDGSSIRSLVATLRTLLASAQDNLAKLQADMESVAAKAYYFADVMEYGFLFNESRQLLSIGYDGPKGEVHSACYDLLSSEARIASFLAVAKGDIPQRSWFRLDRSHVLVNGRAALLSWTGTMFEYLMPSLWMQTFPNTLISRSLESAVRIQRDHVRSLKRGNIPWGISESGFAKTDSLGRYGYQAFGIPALALKYGAEDGPVIAPYASFLALPLLRRDALANLRKMASLDWLGAYGFYEAADYMEGREPQLVRSWMAHHQGMSLLALLNLLRDNIVQRWFHANPRVRAAELLLHEKPVSKDTLKALAKVPPQKDPHAVEPDTVEAV